MNVLGALVDELKEKSVPVALQTLQGPYVLARDRIRASTVTGR
jgi:hypothetical protein